MRILKQIKEWWTRPWVIEITPLPGVWIGDSREVILKELIEAMCPKGCILVWDEVEHGVNWVDLDKGADL